MEFPKQQVLSLIESRLGSDQAQQAAQQLPDQVDHQQHGGLLQQFGLNPQELTDQFGGGGQSGGGAGGQGTMNQGYGIDPTQSSGGPGGADREQGGYGNDPGQGGYGNEPGQGAYGNDPGQGGFGNDPGQGGSDPGQI